MADATKPTEVESTTREDLVTSSQQQDSKQQQQPESTHKSIEMEDLSTNPKPLSVTADPDCVEDTAGTSTSKAGPTDGKSINQALQTDKELPAPSQPSVTAAENSTAGPSDAPGNEDSQSAKAHDKGSSTPAATAPEQETLTIDPAEPAADETLPSDLVVDIMLIVTQSNSRHPFRISEKYLAKRSVAVTGRTDDGRVDPMSITVYTLKELILRDWRKEWEAPPREPVSIRLIYFGKMLEDKLPLSHYNFSHAAKNVVHMTVKPQEIIDEEEANKKVKESGSSSRGSGCCVIL